MSCLPRARHLNSLLEFMVRWTYVSPDFQPTAAARDLFHLEVWRLTEVLSTIAEVNFAILTCWFDLSPPRDVRPRPLVKEVAESRVNIAHDHEADRHSYLTREKVHDYEVEAHNDDPIANCLRDGALSAHRSTHAAPGHIEIGDKPTHPISVSERRDPET